MRRAKTITVVGALVLATLSVPLVTPATAVVPRATGNNAVITVKVGSDRTGTAGVTSLAGVELGLFANAGDADPVAGFGTCTSDLDGDCSFTVPNTQAGPPIGANRNRRFFVKQISAPAGYFSNPSLVTGGLTGPFTSNPYRFQTGTQLQAGMTYRSSTDFMIDTGTGNDTASGGIWQDSRNNPNLPPQCGLHVAIIADLSASVGAAGLTQLKSAATTFVNSLAGTPSTVSLFTFATDSPAAGAANVNRPALMPVSTAAGAATVNGFINGWTLPSGGFTNWDRAFAAVANSGQNYDLTTIITDGNPTVYGTAPVQQTGRTRFREVENGIFSANAVKAQGTRIVAVGVGTGVAGAPDNLRAISGPTLNSDYFQTTNYAAAGAALRALALGNCTGSVTVVKQVLPPGTPANSIAGAQPDGGWTFSASTGTSGVTITPASGQTADGTGALNFALTFPGGTDTAPVNLAETQQTGFTLHPVGGFNATCVRTDTGASLPVTNAATGPGFTVTADSDFPVSCTVFNTAPQPPAALVVNKQWVVNGTTFPNGQQPAELQAQLTVNGGNQDWGNTVGGFAIGDSVSIGETTTVASTSLCTVTGSQLTMANGTPATATLPSNQTLTLALNTYQITNTVSCPSRLTLVKQVDGGSADPTDWTLTAVTPDGAMVGPSGPTGSPGATADVSPLVTYPLAESGGDPRYIQFVNPNATLIPQSTGSWNCVQVGPDGVTVVPGFSDGLNGGVTVPAGFWVQCTAVNQTAQLTLVKHVVNTHGGTAVASDWTLTGTPEAPVPDGLGPVSVAGSETGNAAQVRPNQNYDLTESGPPGYTASDWVCSADVLRSGPDGSVVAVAPGAEATCTITNTDQPAHLTLVKQVDHGATGATDPPTAWTLAADGPTPISGSTGSGAVTEATVDSGSYDLSEADGPGGYTASVWSCVGGTSSTASSVTLGPGDDATCTIVNTAVPPQLTLVKQVVNTHGGTATAANWTLTAVNGDSTITGQSGTPAVTGATGIVGTYDLAESGGPDGYTASDWVCTGGISSTTTSVTLGPGDHATCTITNSDQPAHLTLRKIVDAGESGSGKTPADWTLTATPVDIPGQDPVTGNGDPTTPGGVNNVAVFSGAYTLSETGPPGFTAGSWVCTGGTQSGTDDATVTVPTGGSVSCEITNTAIAPRLTLVKQVDNDDTGATTDPTAWTLIASGPSTISGVTGSSDVTAAAAKVGSYSLNENGPPGYTASAWVCTGATDSTDSSVTLAEGDDATCTIVNTVVAPTLTLVKMVDNGDSGGTAVPTDWTLTGVNGPSTITGTSGTPAVTSATARVGIYTLSEADGPPGYTASAWVCTGGSGSTGSTVTLGAGDDATCTITNTAVAPTLTLVKRVDNGDSGGTAVPTDWTLTAVNGSSTISGKDGSPDVTAATAIVGTYDLSEGGGPAGYTASAWECTGDSGSSDSSVTLGLGDDATCTITNIAVAPTLTLVKVVDNGNTGATAVATDWTLSASGPSTISGVTGSSDVTSAAAQVGSYTLSEDGPSGYRPSNWSCTGATSSGDTSVTLALGDDATCTITNTATEPTLTLVKMVDNGDSGGTAVPTDWTLTAVNGPSTITGKSGSPAVTVASAAIGTYTLSESGGPPGYTASAWACTGGNASTDSSVTLGLSEDATCVITNTAIAPKLTLVKKVDNGDTGATAKPADWTLSAVNGSSTISGTSGSEDVTAVQAAAGTYTLSEKDGPGGYTASSWSCAGSTSSTGTSVTLALGEDATCTITNTAVAPMLTLVKKVDNGRSGAANKPTDWTLDASGPVGISGATGDQAVTNATIKVGTYQLSENGPTGYTASDWSCSGAVSSTASTVTITAGDAATCTITNTAIEPTLTLIKQVHNRGAGTHKATDWTLGAHGPSTIAGPTGSSAVTAALVAVGAYQLSESGPSGYRASNWTCTGGRVDDGTVQVDLGATVVCTIVNTYDPSAPPPPPPAPPLPDTGAAALPWIELALAMLLAGGLLLIVGRRRRRT